MNHTVNNLTFDEHEPIEGASFGALVATAEIDGLITRFVWNRTDTGDGAGQIHVQTGNFRPFFDWNVWDYAAGKAKIPFSLNAFQAYVSERLTFDSDLDMLFDMRLAFCGVGV